jgi:hypothetical protein
LLPRLDRDRCTLILRTIDCDRARRRGSLDASGLPICAGKGRAGDVSLITTNPCAGWQSNRRRGEFAVTRDGVQWQESPSAATIVTLPVVTADCRLLTMGSIRFDNTTRLPGSLSVDSAL